ncbi:MAG: GNAT family N-acetyltransferase [Gammaproteobacteria bacterium]|nr:GNAT family N-acetyltransferase [Gammaproteobacteria bacterium]MBT6042478.1 GNAT family N-acetyltransferase [Gammaproteobacteria bacterium]
MSVEKVIYRPAVRQDARRIAELFSIASDGVSDYIWSKISQPGDNLLDIGQQRYERKNTPFSFENCLVADKNDLVVAVLLSYEMRADNDYVEDDPVLKPFWLLEEPKSLYVAGIAVDESSRQQGIAATLMEMTEAKCRKLKLAKLSLIVFEANTVAYDLYSRRGYTEVMRKAIVPHQSIHYTGDALLLVKKL